MTSFSAGQTILWHYMLTAFLLVVVRISVLSYLIQHCFWDQRLEQHCVGNWYLGPDRDSFGVGLIGIGDSCQGEVAWGWKRSIYREI